MNEIPKYNENFGTVVYFQGCAGTYINTMMVKAAVSLLDEAGVNYTVWAGLSIVVELYLQVLVILALPIKMESKTSKKSEREEQEFL